MDNFQKTVKADSKYAFHLYCFDCIAAESYLLDVLLLPREDRAALLPDPDELRRTELLRLLRLLLDLTEGLLFLLLPRDTAALLLLRLLLR